MIMDPKDGTIMDPQTGKVMIKDVRCGTRSISAMDVLKVFTPCEALGP